MSKPDAFGHFRVRHLTLGTEYTTSVVGVDEQVLDKPASDSYGAALPPKHPAAVKAAAPSKSSPSTTQANPATPKA